MNKKKKLILLIVAGLLLLFLAFLIVIINLMSAPSKTYEEKNIIIPEGSTYYDIASILKEENVIKNEKIFVYYLKVRRIDNIYAAAYYLSPDMNVKEVVDVLLEGGHNENEITITFQEGINMRKVATIISEKTNNSYDDVMKLLKDDEYINSLIEKYWFLTDDIKNSSIYYPLEGYIYPDTYRIASADSSISDIFTSMLDKMEDILDKYKEDIEDSNYTIHELLTIASLTELEGTTDKNRKDIAGVFYNRLKQGMSLGSDVTTYYAFKVDMSERDLYLAEINTYNAYNTRGPEMAGKLPVGPIACVSKSAIEAAIYPNNNDYLYFVADKNGEVYFTKTTYEHEKIIEQLQEEGLWYEW